VGSQVGRDLLAVDSILLNATDYRDLGPYYFDDLNCDHLEHCYTRRLAQLGFEVSLCPDDQGR
jgi:hypothetical protein